MSYLALDRNCYAGIERPDGERTQAHHGRSATNTHILVSKTFPHCKKDKEYKVVRDIEQQKIRLSRRRAGLHEPLLWIAYRQDQALESTELRIQSRFGDEA